MEPAGTTHAPELFYQYKCGRARFLIRVCVTGCFMHSLSPGRRSGTGAACRFAFPGRPAPWIFAPEENPVATHHSRLHTGMMRGRRLHHAIGQNSHQRDKTPGNCRYYPCPYAGRRLAARHRSPRELAHHHDRPAAPRPCSPRAPSLIYQKPEQQNQHFFTRKWCRDVFPAQSFLSFFPA